MILVIILLAILWSSALLRVYFGRRTSLGSVHGALFTFGACLLPASVILLSPVYAFGISLVALAASSYLAFTMKLPPRLIDWSISTRAYTDGFNRDYPTVRMWAMPGFLFRFLAKCRWSVRLGLLLPGEFDSGVQQRYRDVPASDSSSHG